MVKLDTALQRGRFVLARQCAGCGWHFPFFSQCLGVCPQCLRQQFDLVLPRVECLEAARAQGLRRVRLGNTHLLGAG